MDKRALCAFDTKRFLLDNGCDTLAYGHKDITHNIIQEQIENPGGDIILTAKQARESGLVWSRRRGVEKRLGLTPDDNGEETEGDAVAAGKAIRETMRKRLEGVIDIPDKLIPQDLRPGARRKPETESSSIVNKRSRLRIDSEEDSCPITKKRSQLRINSENESSIEPTQNGEEQSEFPIDSSTSLQKSILPTIPKTIEIYSGPNRTTSKKSSVVRSFFLEEAEESKNDADDDSWPVPSRSSSPSRSHLEFSDEESEGEADSDDSFMVGDDIFD